MSAESSPAQQLRLPEYGAPITLALAKPVYAAAEAEALAHGWPMVIAIVDRGGHLVLLHKQDHAQYGSIPIAQAKAAATVKFKCPTRVFEDAVAAGGLGLRLLSTDVICPLEGGLPLVHEGKVIGAIGVSGMQSTQDAQDAQVANVGARVLDA